MRLRHSYLVYFCGILAIALAWQNCGRRTAVSVQQILQWLPADTQTLLVTDRPLWMSNFGIDVDPKFDKEISGEDLEKLFQREILWFFHIFFGDTFDKQRISVAAEGSSRFRRPDFLGLMPYEGCQIAVFRDDQTSRFDKFLRSGRNIEIEEIEKHRVIVLKQRFERDTWTFYGVKPFNNVIAIATNRSYLQEMLARIHTREGKRALPESLPEWQYVDRKAQFWGVRHYSKTDSLEDPSSPFGGTHMANLPDEQAIGITFACTPDKQRSATITYLSTNPSIRQWVEGNLFPPDREPQWRGGLRIKYRDIGRNAVEGSFALDHFSSVNYFLFILLGSLGHAVFV